MADRTPAHALASAVARPEPDPQQHRPGRAGWGGWRPTAWIVFYLALLDLGANLFAGYPADPRDISPTRLQQYFEYGRSVEGKLDRMTRGTDEESAPILTAGWLRGAERQAEPGVDDGRGKPTVTFFGMSHAQILATEMARQDTAVAVRFRTAPGATPIWAYTAYLYDRERRRSDVAVLAVMTNTIPLVSTTAGTTMYFDGAYPYTWPRYRLEHGALRSIDPPFMSLEEYRQYFFDETRWRAYTSWLAENDKYYDPLLFRRTILDRSSLVRLLRRSYALSSRAAKQSDVYDEQAGFRVLSEEVAVLEAVVTEFGRLARGDGSIPVVFVVNNLQTSDRAFRLLHPVLSRDRIPFLSSHEICPPNDPRNYLPDSHFEETKNRLLAQAMADLIEGELARRQSSAGAVSMESPPETP